MRRLCTLFISVVVAAPLTARSSKNCQNAHTSDAECQTWADAGECDKNVGFMKQQCAKACDSCGWTDDRCSDRSGQQPTKRNGDIDATFERAVAEFGEFGPRVHSRPPQGPWIITFDNFVTDDEAEAFITTTVSPTAATTQVRRCHRPSHADTTLLAAAAAAGPPLQALARGRHGLARAHLAAGVVPVSCVGDRHL
jgi:hypothetical protein